MGGFGEITLPLQSKMFFADLAMSLNFVFCLKHQTFVSHLASNRNVNK